MIKKNNNALTTKLKNREFFPSLALVQQVLDTLNKNKIDYCSEKKKNIYRNTMIHR